MPTENRGTDRHARSQLRQWWHSDHRLRRVEGAFAIARQPDGKLVAAGTTYINYGTDFALARYNSDGTLDSSFGNGGKVTLNFGPWDQGTSVAVQQDGKIVIAGGANNVYTDFGLARYNSDGTLDSSFGVSGIVITQFESPQFGHVSATPYSMVLQQDGKIVLAGVGNIDGGEGFALARYNSNGTLDPSFGTGGKVTTEFGTLQQGFSWAFANSLALQVDGKIVAAGSAYLGQSENFALVRYNSDGTLDSSFGTSGQSDQQLHRRG